MKCIINFFKKLLGYHHEEYPVFLPVPEEHQIMVNEEKACELQENLDVVEIESEEPICLGCGKVKSQCECGNNVTEICPDCASEQCTCEKEEKVEEPVKKKRRGRPRKKQNKNKE